MWASVDVRLCISLSVCVCVSACPNPRDKRGPGNLENTEVASSSMSGMPRQADNFS